MMRIADNLSPGDRVIHDSLTGKPIVWTVDRVEAREAGRWVRVHWIAFGSADYPSGTELQVAP